MFLFLHPACDRASDPEYDKRDNGYTQPHDDFFYKVPVHFFPPLCFCFFIPLATELPILNMISATMAIPSHMTIFFTRSLSIFFLRYVFVSSSRLRPSFRS